MADQRDETGATPATPPPATTPSTTPAVPTERPKPAFGEYAPEGWEWKPEESESSPDSTTASPATAAAAPARPDASRLTGVPHNLGAGSSSTVTPNPVRSTPPPANSAKPSNGDPEPYRATSAPAAPAQYVAQPNAAAGPRPRTGDRIVTIVLLVIGAIGALISAQSMLALNSSFTLMGEAVGLTDFEVPSWLGTLGTVSALAFIAVYAVTLIFSIQRMRARKITFWVPLTSGVVVMIAMFVLTTIAIMNMPELMSQLSDPDATQRMLDYLSTTP